MYSCFFQPSPCCFSYTAFLMSSLKIMSLCGGQILRWSLRFPSPDFVSLCNPLTLECGWDLWLTNIIQQRPSVITLHKIVMSVILRDSLPFWPYWKSPCGKELSVTFSCQLIEPPHPTVHEEMNAANSHMNLKADPCLLQPQRRPWPWRTF